MPEPLIGLPKKKNFTCGICHQSRTYGSWEDAEVFFQDDFICHIGCLKSDYKNLIQKGTFALEKLQSALEAFPYGIHDEARKILNDAQTNLAEALRAE